MQTMKNLYDRMIKYIRNTAVFFSVFLFFNMCAYAGELTFAQAADVNYSAGGADIQKNLYFLKLSISKQKPDFTIFLGNNISSSSEENAIGFMQHIYSLKKPYYIVFGNNDAHKISGIEKSEYLNIIKAFNKKLKNKKTYYYFKPNRDFICVILDDSPDFMTSKHGEIPDEQLIWLDNLLNKYPRKMFLIFQHSPLIPPYKDAALELKNPDAYKEILDKHSNVILISSGHYSKSAVFKDEKGRTHISAPAFFQYPSSYQLIKIIYDKKNKTDAVKITVKEIKV